MENYEQTILDRPEWADLTDEEVIEIVRQGGRDGADAVDLLLERYKDLVRVKTRPYFLLGADRADLIQEGMIGLYKAIMAYQPENIDGGKECDAAETSAVEFLCLP